MIEQLMRNLRKSSNRRHRNEHTRTVIKLKHKMGSEKNERSIFVASPINPPYDGYQRDEPRGDMFAEACFIASVCLFLGVMLWYWSIEWLPVGF